VSAARRAVRAGLAASGRWVLDGVGQLGEWVTLWVQTNRVLARGAIAPRAAFRQMDALGVGSVPMACMTVTFSSMVLAFYTIDQFQRYGFTDYLGMLIGIGVWRELGPVLTAIVVAAREGSRISAEIASMKVTEQIDALRALATDPVEYLVVPRYIGALVGMPPLTFLASAVGVAGGYLVAAAKEVPREVYWNSVWSYVEPRFIVAGMVKALVFGAIIATISCRQGLATGHGAAAVGRSTTASVVLCVLAVHVADFGLALVFGG
jgi:phospholipid/cholesterol/gamma-HCH transport system permease protein